MEVHFTPEQQARLCRMAEAQGCPAEFLVNEAVERLLSYEDWFSREIEKGLIAAGAGELIEHDEVRRIIEARFPG